ncbi:hypothetical protein FNV43_RR02829 [Rhamnella rubrinervis]|uniref:Cupin type-1 domain-containing protein n=1 Tax=Rhamnella rubrinervis TaxID=2594499 RepID=A0A8K0HH80_9ROSA|nr:hypothetical protein FNV43_RR02829 [Rhamnella rubrinervis]
MQGVHLLSTIVVLALASFIASATDPGPLQDFCVAVNDTKTGLFVNGKFCKNPDDVVAEDFFTSGLNMPGDTSGRVGSNVTTVNVDRIAGLNTLGITLVRIDFAPYGENPPHTHPRATEILVVAEGTLEVGFFNRGHENAVAFAALSSQNPGVITIANAVFGSDPRINSDVLTKAFQVDKNVIDYLQKQFWETN